MNTVAEKVASYLLDIKAIKLEPTHPFTWASGWKSPIYCDNRKTLSYPEVRSYIKEQFAALIREKYPQADCRGCYRSYCTGGVSCSGIGITLYLCAIFS